MKKNDAFLGKGWNFPPSFNTNGAVVTMVSAEEDIKQSLLILFTTEINERLMHPLYGCELNQFIYEKLSNGLINQVRNIIEEAILFFEPRIDVNEVNASIKNSPTPLVLIDINFTIRVNNSRSNFVYPFYLNEANYDLNQ